MFSINQAKSSVREFLGRYFRTDDLRDDEDIFASGRVTSMVAMELVLFLENQMRVKVENEDLHLDNFRSVDAIVALAGKKLSRAA